MHAMCPPHLIFFNLITLIMWSKRTNNDMPHYAIFSSFFLGHNIFFKPLDLTHPQYIPTLIGTKPIFYKTTGIMRVDFCTYSYSG